MPSIIIAAHNEEAVIARCLGALLDEGGGETFDVTVVANGCSDQTAAVARRHNGVRVLELPQAGKVGALNAGDDVAQGFPRVYLDADILLSAAAVHRLCAALTGPVQVAAPRRRLDVRGRPLGVRAYFAINARLPVYRQHVFGRGAVAVSAPGRARFGEFPAMVADDLFLDGLFAPSEKRVVDEVSSIVATPLTTRSLYRRLIRVRAGNAAMRAAAKQPGMPVSVPASQGGAWLRVAVRRPWLLPAALGYAAITAAAAATSRRRAGEDVEWGHDESSRVPLHRPMGQP